MKIYCILMKGGYFRYVKDDPRKLTGEWVKINTFERVYDALGHTKNFRKRGFAYIRPRDIVIIEIIMYDPEAEE